MTQLLLGLQTLIRYGFEFYRMALLVYFLLSWLPGARQSGLGQFLEKICEPYVGYFRRYIPPIGMISFAGMVAYAALIVIERGFYVVIGFLLRMIS